MIFPLLIAAAAGAGGYFAGKSKEEAEMKKLIRIAQDHRARAAEMQHRFEQCSKKLAAYNPVLNPSFMNPASALASISLSEDEAREAIQGGESWKNI